MRLLFPNTTRPKKAAKQIARRLGLPLAEAQRGIARACGYRDWHELEASAASASGCLLDQNLARDEFVARRARLNFALAVALGIPNGDAQYALAGSRLTGDFPPALDDEIALRLACFRATSMPEVAARAPGAVGKLKSSGRDGEPVILRHFGHLTEAVTNQSIVTVADFEYVSPRARLPLFLPMRLYLPYGAWTEEDGARVIFARDYKPMWRVRGNGAVERLEPWLRIGFNEQVHFWSDGNTPWRDPQLKAELEAGLVAMGIIGLPILVDALPLLVNAPADGRLKMEDAADLLKEARCHQHPLAAA